MVQRWVFLMARKVQKPGPPPHSDKYLAWDGMPTYERERAANYSTQREIVAFAKTKGVAETPLQYPYQVDFDERELRYPRR